MRCKNHTGWTQGTKAAAAPRLLGHMLDRLRGLIGRLTGALADPRRRERTVIAVLIGYALVWMLYGLIAKAGQDVQIDAAEVVAWSRHLALGYAKHPPLAAWLVAAWFTVFPVADWSYYLFGTAYSALGLWLAWRLAGDAWEVEVTPL